MSTELFNDNGIILTRFSLGLDFSDGYGKSKSRGAGYQITEISNDIGSVSYIRLTRDQAISLLAALSYELK